MCLGIPGQIVEVAVGHDDLATVDVSGVQRSVNVALLRDEALGTGDWVLVHVGFAMSKIDEHEAEVALASLRMMGGAFDDEMQALLGSAAGDGPPGSPGSGPEGRA